MSRVVYSLLFIDLGGLWGVVGEVRNALRVHIVIVIGSSGISTIQLQSSVTSSCFTLCTMAIVGASCSLHCAFNVGLISLVSPTMRADIRC